MASQEHELTRAMALLGVHREDNDLHPVNDPERRAAGKVADLAYRSRSQSVEVEVFVFDDGALAWAAGQEWVRPPTRPPTSPW